MPTFSPSQSVTAKAKLPVKPAGMACQAELYLGTGKAATSGKVPFTSTGADQTITLPLTMPSSGSYQALLDIFTSNILIGAFYDPEQVVIAVARFSYGTPWAGPKMPCPSIGPVTKSVDVYCVVTNPSGATLTKTLWVQWTRWDESTLWSMNKLMEFEGGAKSKSVTLAPGQSYTLHAPYHYYDVYGDEVCNVPGGWWNVYVRLLDSDGVTSPVIMVS